MKKLILLVLLIIPLVAKSQNSVLSSLYRDYLLYQQYTTEGPATREKITRERLIKATDLWNTYLISYYEGETDTMALALTALNSLYGKTHATPTLSGGGSSSPGGVTGDIQYNQAGGFAAAPLTTNGTDISVDTKLLIDEGLTYGTSTGVWFGDGNTGFYESSDNNLYLNLGGSTGIMFSSTQMQTKDIVGIAASTYNNGTQSVPWAAINGDTVRVQDTLLLTYLSPSGGEVLKISPTGGIYAEANASDTTTVVATKYDIIDMVEFADTTGIIATEYDIRNMVEDADIIDMVEFADTASIIATQYDLTLVDGGGSPDSTYYGLTVYDTLVFIDPASQNGTYMTVQTNGLISVGPISSGFKSAPFYSISGTAIYKSTNGLNINFNISPTSVTPNIIPRYDDSNTGYSWVSSDKLGLVGGGVSLLTAEYNSSLAKAITKIIDSVYVNGGIMATRAYLDSISVNGVFHKNVLGYGDSPASISLRAVEPDGSQSFATLEEDLDTPTSASLTDGAPTYVEINAALSTNPATAGSGARYLIKDSDGTALMYVVWSDGSDWWYEALTKAL